MLDYAAGKAAFLAEDWQGTVGNLTMVVMRRPWHDNAHTMLGYAWRKLGNYDLSLDHLSDCADPEPTASAALANIWARPISIWTVRTTPRLLFCAWPRSAATSSWALTTMAG